ncbi:MAG: hypothetical protein IPL54_06945 [Chitinophagaceae bacterium]|nr:hypothetical protein [Chitinophagaceae bacterium]
MKKFTLCLFISFSSAFLVAQDVRLNDSVIFINNDPVALYAKTLNTSTPRYNMEVYSFDDYVLIKAEVIKFNAPVAELKPFYYYELTFPPTADTFAVYIEDEAFPLVLAKIIRDYDLISKNELNKKNVARFMQDYYGGPALTAKIKSFEDYLNETRYFNEQEKRDRTKPVTIINNNVIMQDGVKIGLIVQAKNSNVSRQINNDMPPVYDSTRIGITQRVFYEDVVRTSTEMQILLYSSNRRIDNLRRYNTWSPKDRVNTAVKEKTAAERNLYQVSKAAYKKNSIYSEGLLMTVCYLIEDYAL